MMILILLIILIVVINFLNARSDAFSEEIRKSKVIEELPITKKDINKLFKKLLRHLFPAPHGGVGPFGWPTELLKSQRVELVLVEVHCDSQSIL